METVEQYLDNARNILGPDAQPTQIQTIVVALMLQINDAIEEIAATTLASGGSKVGEIVVSVAPRTST